MIAVANINNYINMLKGLAALIALCLAAISYFASADDLGKTNQMLNEFRHEVYTSMDEMRLEEIQDTIIELELKPEKTDYDNLRLQQKRSQKERILRRLEKSEKIRGAW